MRDSPDDVPITDEELLPFDPLKARYRGLTKIIHDVQMGKIPDWSKLEQAARRGLKIDRFRRFETDENDDSDLNK